METLVRVRVRVIIRAIVRLRLRMSMRGNIPVMPVVPTTTTPLCVSSRYDVEGDINPRLKQTAHHPVA